jgi:hypothetical protein
MLKKSSPIRPFPLGVFLILAVFGAAITPQFGESWDELKFYKYASLALGAYRTWPSQGVVEVFGDTYDNYGPAYAMLVTLAARPLGFLFSESDARHYLYFLTFLAGIWSFHQLAGRWLSRNAALFATLLFATQPVFIGHAFIGPKDLPFLSFFLLSLHLGLRLFDSPIQFRLKALDRGSGRALFVLSSLWLAAAAGLFLFTGVYHAFIAGLVQSAKAGTANIISLVASDIDTADPQVYIQRYFVFFLWFRSGLFLLISAASLLFIRRASPDGFALILAVLPASVLLGFTTSIRVLGPFAAILLAYQAIRRHGRDAFVPLGLYGVFALIAMYLTWPYLWVDPIGHFLESVQVMSRYPWQGRVLFDGAEYPSTQLPFAYLPVLLGIQLTEPVWALALLGLIAAARGSNAKRELIGLTIVWFLIPLAGFVFTHAPLYDNFRQVFFILPPVFILAGAFIDRVGRAPLQIALMALCLVPGIVDAVRLHPYEYIYYNRFIGGVGGAFRRYELDYWGTSYREAAGFVNANAAADATVWVDGPAHLFELYARQDIRVYSDYEADRAPHYEYVISTSRYDLDLTSFPEARIVHTIERGGGILSVIKQPERP